MNKIFPIFVVAVVCATAAGAAEFSVHGDLNNRFNLYTNHSEFYSAASTLEKGVANTKIIGDETTNTTWGDAKYRLWTEASTNDGAVKGVYAIELGALRYGRSGSGKSKGGGFSGDGVNIETRWAYTDLLLPGLGGNARLKMGLQPFKVNHYVWQETAMGISLAGKAGTAGYKLAWMRGSEVFNDEAGEDFSSLDNFVVRGDFRPVEGLKAGLFALYQTENGSEGTNGAVDAGKYGLKQFGAVDLGLYTLGVDGGYKTSTSLGEVTINFDLMYQGGSVDNVDFTALDGTRSGDFDVSAWFAHADVGLNLGSTRLTYTTWYATGDDKADDGDFNAFLATDVDMFDSVVLFEGGFNDDNYATERPYILDKGMYLNKLAFDYLPTAKLKTRIALLYLLTAEDIAYTDDNGRSRSDNALGTEIDASLKYQLYKGLEVAWNFGYLVSGDAMDTFEIQRDGSADENIYRTTARVRYKF